MGSKRSKSTPLTVEESLSGEYQEQFGVQQPSMRSYDDRDHGARSYDQDAIGAHRGGASRGGGSYQSFQQGDYSYSGSYLDGDQPPEEQYYQDQYLSEHGSQCYTDDGEPYYGEDQGQFEQHEQYYGGKNGYNDQKQSPPYEAGYHQGHPDGYPHQYDDERYPEEYDGYQHGHPEAYDEYQIGHPDDYNPEYREAKSQDYRGHRQADHYDEYDDGYDRGHGQQRRDWPQPEEEFSHFDDQEQSYVSYGQNNKRYSSYEARQNAEGHWEEASEIDGGGTISSKTLNTNLEGMKYIPPYDNNTYYGGEESAFDYSEGPELARSEPPEIPFHGASTLESPLHDDEGSQGSGSVWDGTDLRNRSLVDNPVSPLSQTQFTIGNRTEYSDESRSTRRPVSRFIQKTKKNVGCAGVTYGDGEFQVRAKRGKRGGGGSRSKSKRGESATILDIMFNVGHDLIVGTSKDRGGRRRKRDPAGKIVDGFKEMFNCGVDNDVDDDDDDDYGSYHS
ncbi:unnamed protein product [Cylindrotheca closterium]|uniref:Uncharacterized protein n=1 Tax=Cylindrotheca closterium TaxID=2856 RepID=A0AAD2G7H8_9STRA|nr:unnamed protein product [Cylindrotheca closterium]